MITLLDGPLGTQLESRGIPSSTVGWSAGAVESAPEVIAAIHRDYADAGATVHTANTFRTQQRHVGSRWRDLALKAIRLARDSVPSGHRIAGSIAPLEDCYRPDLSPGESARDEHRDLAELLAKAGCDILLCETFANPTEGLVAVDEATRTGVETWFALTAGPDGTLLSPGEIASAAKAAVDHGASAVLINCTAAAATLPLVQAVAAVNLGVPFGAYANAGLDPNDWQRDDAHAVQQYVAHATEWQAADATIIGGCCGTGPRHISGLARIAR